MGLPPRVYYTLNEVTARWGCNIADIAGWADAGRFRIVTGITAVGCGDEVVAGKVVLSPMELLPLFRRCGTGPAQGSMRIIQPAVGRNDWLLITEPAGGLAVAVADMLIPAEEVHAFEEENDMVRRASTGTGAKPTYDWDGMTLALIKRIYDHGLPASQAELVAEMQDWFADQSNGKAIPESRSVRRRVTPVWKLLQTERA